MFSEKFQNKLLPLCQNIKCSKNKHAERIFWKKEIDHQYKFYLATLRAERDAKFLIREHADLMRRSEEAEKTHVKLRKEIWLLETELFLMYQRNAHDSAVIDGLQEADCEAKETDDLELDLSHKMQIAKAEGEQEDALSVMLKEEIDLLKKKDAEDKELVALFKPLEIELKKTLDEEKLKTHQQGMRFKRELEELQLEFEKRNSDLEAIVDEKSSAILWAAEAFSSIFGRERDQQVLIETSDQQVLINFTETESVGSSEATDLFDVSSFQESIMNRDEPGKDFQKKIEEYREFIALKELLDSKNLVNTRVVLNCLKQFTEGVQNLAEDYLSVFEVVADIEFVKEYLQRLDLMRKKKDLVVQEIGMDTAQRLDQLNLIYTSLMCEKMFLMNSLQYFTSTFPEDFEAHCVTLRKTEELFTWTVQSSHDDEA